MAKTTTTGCDEFLPPALHEHLDTRQGLCEDVRRLVLPSKMHQESHMSVCSASAQDTRSSGPVLTLLYRTSESGVTENLRLSFITFCRSGTENPYTQTPSFCRKKMGKRCMFEQTLAICIYG